MPDGGELSVVIPTRDRWPVLRQTLGALAHQSVQGFETIVVIDGGEPARDDLPPGVTMIRVEHGGPGAARNAGVAASTRPLVLFLGDDMVPDEDLVAMHLEAHRRWQSPDAAVLGRVDWHPEVRDNRLLRWLDWSGTQFDFPTAASEAGFGRFYSCNVSVKRRLFDAVGGFDPRFVYYYEDLDLGWRLGQQGMRLYFEPAAVTHHLHSYDWNALERRFKGIGAGERLMHEIHPWFEPHYAARISAAESRGRIAPFWTRVSDLARGADTRLRRVARDRANARYHQQLAPAFSAGWWGDDDIRELREYLGASYDPELLTHHQRAVDDEEHAAPDETTFYRTSTAYLYDLSVFATSATKEPYRAAIRRVVPRGARLLDYGCGIGSDGLRFMHEGYCVEFADFDNPSAAYLRWRLQRRSVEAAVHDLERSVPDGYDLAYSFDVIEHIEDPYGFLGELERRAAFVAVNLLEPDPADTHLHRPLPIRDLLNRAARLGVLHYRRYHGRSHLVIYRTGRASPAGKVASRLRRWAPPVGRRLHLVD
jgi:glycosyltransferase involved in cell wall biosynthesis